MTAYAAIPPAAIPPAASPAAALPAAGAPAAGAPEPLASLADFEEYRDALALYRSGAWDDDRWKAFRLRFGVYGQLQPNVQMVRIKIPGGHLPIPWLRVIAEANRRWAGSTAHITTRQDFQIYFIKLDDTPDLLEHLYSNGVTTREACGNTLRNMTSCQLAGVCPRERVDASQVAARLARSWIRHPLVQHMPRKFKITVSGCATDCASTHIHDLGLIATEKDGNNGFIVYAGGGTGGVSVSAVKVADFVTEHELPAVVEALTRLHQRYSDRKNRNKARIKFLQKRFGADKFRELFAEEFARIRALPQRPWEPLEWREPEDAPVPETPGGVVRQHDGRTCVVVNAALGLFTSDQLDALADIAERHGAERFLITREQNMAIMGLDPETADAVVAAVRELGFGVEERPGDVSNVIACPGTTTCGIGITNSQSFGKEILDQVRNYAAKPDVTVNISGCQNGCGLHHVSDFGFQGMGKKIDAKNAPHYRILIGGHKRENGHIGLRGPIVPARLAQKALTLYLDSYAATKVNGESVRDWAIRLGKKGLAEIVEPLNQEIDPKDEGLFFDWGEDWEYAPPTGRTAECAAAFAEDDLLKDLADDGLITLDRAIVAGDREAALEGGRAGLAFSARRLLVRLSLAAGDDASAADLAAKVRAHYTDDAELLSALDAVIEGEAGAQNGGGLDPYREALALFIDTVGEVVETAATDLQFDVAGLGDFDTSVLGDIAGRPAAE